MRALVLLLLLCSAANAQFYRGAKDVDSVKVAWAFDSNVLTVTMVSWDTVATPRALNKGIIVPGSLDSVSFRYSLGQLIAMGVFEDYFAECCAQNIDSTIVLRFGNLLVPMPSDFGSFLAQRFFSIYVERERRGQGNSETVKDTVNVGRPRRSR